MSWAPASSPFLGSSPRPTPWRTSQVGARVVCGQGAEVPPGARLEYSSQAGIFLAATCHRPVLGGQLPERRCSGRSGPAVICQERQASAFVHQAPAGCSQAEASGLFLEPGPSPDARIPAEISSGSN